MPHNRRVHPEPGVDNRPGCQWPGCPVKFNVRQEAFAPLYCGHHLSQLHTQSFREEPSTPQAAGMNVPPPIQVSKRGGGHHMHALQIPESLEDCPVCLGEINQYGVERNVTRLHCGHVLHSHCIDSWIATCRHNGNPPTCPYCRAPL